MATGYIYITGQIGNSYKPDGTLSVKGVTVADVVAQHLAQPNCERYEVWIKSQGGSVDEGHEIGKVVAAIKNCFTVATGMCASIATVPFLSVPKENRSIEEGCEFMIHNPLYQNVSGNASELKIYANLLEPHQKELLALYVKATGASKASLQSLMNVESTLTPDLAVTMGFASKVIPKKQLKAVAFFNTKQKPNKMANENTAFAKFFKQMKEGAKALGFDLGEIPATDPARNAVALVLVTDKGSISTPYDDMVIGDPVTMTDTGETAPNDTYVADDGTSIVVVDGMVSEILVTEDSDLETVVAAQAAEIVELKATIAEQTAAAKLMAEAVAQLQAKAIRSTHTPVASVKVFRPQTAAAINNQNKDAITAESIKARRAEYKPKNKKVDGTV